METYRPIVIDEHVLPVRYAGFIGGVRAVRVEFNGKQGWGITMNVRAKDLNSFYDNPKKQREFVEFAKDKLGE